MLLTLPAPAAQARVAQLRVARVATSVVTLEQVRVRLDWPAHAASGELQLWAARVDAPMLGYRFRDLHWRCPLQRIEPAGWQCEGELRSGRAAPLRLSIRLDEVSTRAVLSQGRAQFQLDRKMTSQDVTTLNLTRLPLVWAQALLQQAWPAAHFKAGTLDGALRVEAAPARPLRISGPLQLTTAGLETADAGIVGEGLGGTLRLDYRSTQVLSQVTMGGELHGGEFLAGNTYVALPATPVGLHVQASQRAGQGWILPRIEWHDGDALAASASISLATDGSLQTLQVQAHSDDMMPLKPRYLSGWMGLFGLGKVDLHGALDVQARVANGELDSVNAELHGVELRDPGERFVFNGLHGDLRYSAGAEVDSALQWQSGKLYGLSFGAAQMAFASEQRELRTRAPAQMPMMGGSLELHDVVIRPPQGGAGMDIRFGMRLTDIDFGAVSQALGLPAFQGRLGGDIPRAHYASERIDFDGGLALQLFDGNVAFSDLSLERPFGTAPSLSADIAMDDLDLLRLTEVMGFGSISGKLDGRISGLRLVDWTPVAFDARFITDDAPGMRKRISQRAVQDISSVGGGGLLQSLQGQLIGLFNDFGYRRIGIGCKLENQICAMSGLHSAGNAFTIVEGAGVPRLQVIGYNRAVDWSTLVERLMAAGKGDVAPVID